MLSPAPAAPLVQLCPAAEVRPGLVNYSTARGMSASVGLSVCENMKVSTFFHSLSLDVFSVPGVEQVLGTLCLSISASVSLSSTQFPCLLFQTWSPTLSPLTSIEAPPGPPCCGGPYPLPGSPSPPVWRPHSLPAVEAPPPPWYKGPSPLLWRPCPLPGIEAPPLSSMEALSLPCCGGPSSLVQRHRPAVEAPPLSGWSPAPLPWQRTSWISPCLVSCFGPAVHGGGRPLGGSRG